MSRLLFLVGIASLLAASYLTWQRYTPTRLAFNTSVISSTQKIDSSVPTSIEIPDLSLTLPVESHEFTNGKWPISNRGVVYLTNSAIPGQIGNSILYGHNWPNIFGRLTKIKPGSIIFIGFANGSQKQFVVQYTQEVTPDQTHILSPTTDSRLTLYTCTGFLDQKRFVVTAIAT